MRWFTKAWFRQRRIKYLKKIYGYKKWTSDHFIDKFGNIRSRAEIIKFIENGGKNFKKNNKHNKFKKY